MASFCHFNDTYINKNILSNNTDLDKLAREVNNNKKMRSRDIYNKYRNTQNSLENGIAAYNSLHDAKMDKGTKISPVMDGFFSAQGDYSDLTQQKYDPKDNSGTLISDIYNKKKASQKKLKKKSKKIIKSKPKFKEESEVDISLDSPSCDEDPERDHALMMRMEGQMYLDNNSSDSNSSDDSSSFSSISWSTQEIDRQVKTKSKFKPKKKSKRHKCIDFDLRSVESLESLDSGESLLRHIRFCHECKDKVMELIRKHKSDKLHKLMKKKHKNKSSHIDFTESEVKDKVSKNKKSSNNDKNNKKSSNNDKNNKKSIDNTKVNNTESTGLENIDSGNLQFKEIVTIFLIGFIVIILLDLVMKNQ